MKHVVEYKLHAGNNPYFIEDGGHFSFEGKMIGLTRDDFDCYIPPDTELTTFHTKQAFIDHMVARSMFFSPAAGGAEMTSQEKTNIASDWWDARHA